MSFVFITNGPKIMTSSGITFPSLIQGKVCLPSSSFIGLLKEASSICSFLVAILSKTVSQAACRLDLSSMKHTGINHQQLAASRKLWSIPFASSLIASNPRSLSLPSLFLRKFLLLIEVHQKGLRVASFSFLIPSRHCNLLPF